MGAGCEMATSATTRDSGAMKVVASYLWGGSMHIVVGTFCGQPIACIGGGGVDVVRGGPNLPFRVAATP